MLLCPAVVDLMLRGAADNMLQLRAEGNRDVRMPQVVNEVNQRKNRADPNYRHHGLLANVQVEEHCKRETLQRRLNQTVKNVLHRVNAERSDRRQHLGRMVDFMELPEKRGLVLNVVTDIVTDIEQ